MPKLRGRTIALLSCALIGATLIRTALAAPRPQTSSSSEIGQHQSQSPLHRSVKSPLDDQLDELCDSEQLMKEYVQRGPFGGVFNINNPPLNRGNNDNNNNNNNNNHNRDLNPLQTALNHLDESTGGSNQFIQWYSHSSSSSSSSASSSSGGSAASSGVGGMSGELQADASHSDIADNLNKLMGWRPLVLDLGLNSNGTFKLSLEGSNARLFKLEPLTPVSKRSVFSISIAPIATKPLFDPQHETSQPLRDHANQFGPPPPPPPPPPYNPMDPMGSPFQRPQLQFDLVAKDLGLLQKLSSRIKCLIKLLNPNGLFAPQFDSEMYSFSIYENSQIGQLVGSVRATQRSMASLTSGAAGAQNSNSLSGQNRVKYVNLVGEDSNLFKLNEDSGLITVNGHLDRERKSSYLFLVEARDVTQQQQIPASGNLFSGGRSSFSKIMINIMDLNDNAPLFLQTHYDAILMADGTIHPPLVVRALDADEPSSANSQVAYEIIAGNVNDHFTIDSVSGIIFPTDGSANSPNPAPGTSGSQPNIVYPNGQPYDYFGLANPNFNGYHHQQPPPPASQTKPIPPHIPSILREPIKPFGGGGANSNQNHQNNRQQTTSPPQQHSSSDRISVVEHEVEEPTTPPPPTGSSSTSSASLVEYLGSKLGWNRAKEPLESGQREELDVEGGNHTLAAKSGNATQDLEASYSTRAVQSTATTARIGRLSEQTMPPLDAEQLPALDLLLNLESSHQQAARLFYSNNQQPPARESETRALPVDATRLPPLTTLIVRAHDFGIPLRSSTVKVNIHNQALQSRTMSVILNGTAEQLQLRRETIEQALGSLTGSKAIIESIDALSDTSRISVARVRMTVPQNSLVDLTNLSGLLSALDYHGHQQPAGGSPSGQQDDLQYKNKVTHYVASDGRLYPIGPTTISSNLTSSSGFYGDIQDFIYDPTSGIERRLLIYIIIVGICILALLVCWMIYSCCRETEADEHNQRAKRHDDLKSSYLQHDSQYTRRSQGANGISAAAAVAATTTTTATKTQIKSLVDQNVGTNASLTSTHNQQVAANGTINAKDLSGRQKSLKNRQTIDSSASHLNELMLPIKPEHASMYNGQIWFEPNGLGSARQQFSAGRRASSAPSAASLDSALHSAVGGRAHARYARGAMGSAVSSQRNASGQFFPNTSGYMENLASIDRQRASYYMAGDEVMMDGSGGADRNGVNGPGKEGNSRKYPPRGRKVAPMETQRQSSRLVAPGKPARHQLRRASREDTTDGEPGGPTRGRHTRGRGGASPEGSLSGSCSEPTDGSSIDGGPNSVVLDSDQELLGFDSTGTPIIATHTRARRGNRAAAAAQPLVIEMIEPPALARPVSPARTVTKRPVGVPAARSDEKKSSPPPPTLANQQQQQHQQQVAERKEPEVRGTSKDDAKEMITNNNSNDSEKLSGRKDSKPQVQAAGNLMDELNSKLATKRQKSIDEIGANVVVASGANPAEMLARGAATSQASTEPKRPAPSQTRARLERRPVQSASSSIQSSGSRSSSRSGSTATTVTQTTTGGARTKSGSAATISTMPAPEAANETSSGKEATGQLPSLSNMRNGELLEKQSIFAMTYSGLATDQLPGC